MRVLLVGDVGGSKGYHVGDEAMLTANVDWWKARGAQITVSSDDPVSTAATHRVESIPECKLGSWDLKQFDVVHVSGGGNITALFPPEYELRMKLLRRAAESDVVSVATGQTLGPDADLTPMMACRYVGVRDTGASVALAASYGVDARPCVDDAFVLEERPDETGIGGNVVGVTVHRRHCGDLNDTQLLGQFRKALGALGSIPRSFIPHHPSDSRTGEALGMASRGRPLLDRQVKCLTGRLRCCITTRYHGLVFALAHGVPCLGVYQDKHSEIKMTGAFEVLKLGPVICDVRKLSADVVARWLEQSDEQRNAMRGCVSYGAALYEVERKRMTAYLES